MTRFRRVMKKIGKGFLIFLIILAVVHAVSSAILSRKLEAKIAGIKAQGDPISTLDLGKIDVPDSENAATVYLKIFDDMGTGITYRNGVPQMVGNRQGDLELLKKHGDIRKIAAWEKLYNIRTDEKRTSQMWDDARKSLTTYKDAFELTDEAISMPYCKFRTNWNDGPGVLFPYYAGVRQLARLCHTDALVYIRDGNTDAAVKDASRIFGIGKSLKNEPTLIGQLVRYAILSIGMQCVRELSANGLNATQAQILEKALSDTDLYDGFVICMKGERACYITSYRMLMSGNNMAFTNGMNANQDMPLYGKIGLYVGRPLLYGNMMACLDIMAGYVKDAEVPVMYRDNYAADGTEVVSGKPIPGGLFTVLAKMFLPVFSRASLQRDACEAGIISCRTMLELVKYKHTFGVYPKSFDELKSQLKVDVPVDPMSGKDFRYKRQGEGFLLYSIGPNMRDDGGKWDRRSMYAPSGKDLDDIVWTMTK